MSCKLIIEHSYFPNRFDVYCENCHNPDWDGSGRADADGLYEEDIPEWFDEHREEKNDWSRFHGSSMDG